MPPGHVGLAEQCCCQQLVTNVALVLGLSLWELLCPWLPTGIFQMRPALAWRPPQEDFIFLEDVWAAVREEAFWESIGINGV